MIRTQIQLHEKEYEALKNRASDEHRSMADCVREAIGQYLARSAAAKPDFASVSSQFRPAPLAELMPHDQAWADSILPPGRPCEPSS